jgi:hypothetical protein
MHSATNTLQDILMLCWSFDYENAELGNKCIFNNLLLELYWDQWIAFSLEDKNIAFKNAKTL